MPATSRLHLILRESVGAHSTFGALPLFSATQAKLAHPDESIQDLHWHSRAHRKRRYRHFDEKGRPISEFETLWVKFKRLGKIEWRETSWWVAIFFVVGSIVWVINGFIVFLPEINSRKYPVNDTGVGWTGWLGATIFEFGAATALYEAMNRSDTVNFGGNDNRDDSPEDEECPLSEGNEKPSSSAKLKRYIFAPSKKELWFEIGFWANLVQFWSATIFWISGWTGIPDISSPIEAKGSRLEDGVYWIPQIVGGSGFVIASLLLMLENQKKWWRPSLLSLGWHVGFWNLIGSIGFNLCGIFGLSKFVPKSVDHNWASIQSSCSTFWGGWAFLIGSLVQWWEAVQPPDAANSPTMEVSDNMVAERKPDRTRELPAHP